MMSPSHALVRALLGASSLALALLTLLRSPHPVVVAALVLAALTAYACMVPESVVVSVLVAGHILHWLIAVPVPPAANFSVQDWAWVLVAAWLVLVLHLSASLAASLPPGAAVPRLTVRRWLRRGVVVATATVPVWGVTAIAAGAGVAGSVAFTYAAIMGCAGLALAVWLLSRERTA